MISKSTEKQLLLPSVCRMLERRVIGTTVLVDKKPIDRRDFETFELFFTFDKNCQDKIHPDTADGSQVIFQIAQEAANLIHNRYCEYYQPRMIDIGTIGISKDTSWRFGYEQIPEIEAMVNTIQNKEDLIACWKFHVRFAPEINQIEGRCLNDEISREALPSFDGQF